MSILKKSLGTLLPAMRISVALVLLTSCILMTAEILGFTPNEDKFLIEARTKISESMAIQFAVLDPQEDIKKIQKLIRYLVKWNNEILSAGIRLSSGQLIFQSNDHDELWKGFDGQNSTPTYVLIPIMRKGELWGNAEFRFEQLKSETFLGIFDKSIFKLITFTLLIGFFVYLIFLLKTLRQLDPSSVIPERVNAAFDTLAEGVIIIDENEYILLTNKAFSDKIGHVSSTLIGKKISDLGWEMITIHQSGVELPWKSVLKNGANIVGSQLKLKAANGQELKFALNVSPIDGGNNKTQGVLITLDDITQLEERNTQLQTLVTNLEESKEQVQQQNKELHYLATRDPMTGCLNRRSFSEQFEKMFNQARATGAELSCIMVDLDHFKLVNDNYGHATGDIVIKLLAKVLKSNTRRIDLVGRYGGEEFCVVLPGQTTDEAFIVAERIRLRIKDESTKNFKDGPRVTASLGLASIFDNAISPDALNNQADQALYQAKTTGRNRVMRWKAGDEVSGESAAVQQPKEKELSEAIPDNHNVEKLQTRINELEELASKFSSELDYTKSYDNLTGLPNQLLLFDRIVQSIERGHRHNKISAVLIVDIDNFSEVNATLGREVGDSLLKQFSERLNTTFRKTDEISRLTVSRFGGDEFAVLINDLPHEQQATWAVKRLLDVMNQPIEVDGNMIHISCNVGVSLYPTDAKTAEQLLNNAITAKQYGKKQKTELKYQFYDQHMQDLSIKHLQLYKDLHVAIKKEEWELMYQPKLDIKKKKVIGAEALIRWNHPQRGLISPYEFIDFAEQHRLIIPIGNWVIRQACRQIREWMEMGIHDCKIAVNLSSVQLMQKDIVSNIFKELDQHQVPPRLFEVEITETTLMDNIKVALESLQRLSAQGIHISIDDFGTGYSSLGYLKNLPIDNLKIDRTFIKDLQNDENDRKIVQSLISMAHSLDLSVIAEGVEDSKQFELLNGYGCDEIQGYLLSKPIPAGEFLSLLKSPQKTAQLLNLK